MSTSKNQIRKNVIRISKIHFLLVGLIVAQIILYDSAQLVAPEVVLKRWIMAALLLAITTGVWYFAKNKSTKLSHDRLLLFTLILTDIALVSYLVYSQRGMASRAVLLYAIPILASVALMKRAATYATAILCIAAYTLTAVAYFVLNFNEGYKVELYGEIGFYSACLLLLAGFISTIIPKNN